MQRHEMIEAMRGLGLRGMAGAFDEAVTMGLQRKRTTHEILTDLLRAEAAHRHAASIRYRMTAAKLPVVKDLDAFVFEGTLINEGLVRSLHAGSFLPGRRNIVLIGGTGTGKTHLATAITASVVCAGAGVVLTRTEPRYNQRASWRLRGLPVQARSAGRLPTAANSLPLGRVRWKRLGEVVHSPLPREWRARTRPPERAAKSGWACRIR